MTEPRPTRVDGRETIDRLLEFAERELNEVGAVRFQLSRVLNAAGVSKSSAYHHFGSREGILAAVEMKMVTEQVVNNNKLIRAYVESLPADQSATEFLRLLVTSSRDNAGVEARRRRATTLVAAQSSPLLAEIVRDTQREGADYLVGTLEIVVERGFVSPTAPLRGIAHWIISSTFGRILIDFAADTAVDEDWEEVTFLALCALLRPNS